MARTTSLSGFPEWLPAQRMVEQRFIAELERIFQLHGYVNVETRAIEPLEVLMQKGETSKEVYRVSRLQDDGAGSSGKDLGLHFDLTVPFARYVVENAHNLNFPFKRYQIQKVWRGERPQEGRAREFTQADIDVVGADTLPFHFEVEIPLIMAKAFAALQAFGLPPVQILVNNRKLSQGFYQAHGITDIEGTLRAVDKLHKIGAPKVVELLVTDVGLSPEQANACVKLAQIKGDGNEISTQLSEFGLTDELFAEGRDELLELINQSEAQLPGVVIGDLSVARGLDYYTGSVYESVLVGHESLGSICSGGRYDSLASDGKRTFPGVGMSIGLTRVLMRFLGNKLIEASRQVPTAVLVALESEGDRSASEVIADDLRSRGVPAEVSPAANKYGRQIRHADRRGIPFVYFHDSKSVRDIRTGSQEEIDISTWQPPAADVWPIISAVTED